MDPAKPSKFIPPKQYKIENVINDLNIKSFEPVPQHHQTKEFNSEEDVKSIQPIIKNASV